VPYLPCACCGTPYPLSLRRYSPQRGCPRASKAPARVACVRGSRRNVSRCGPIPRVRSGWRSARVTSASPIEFWTDETLAEDFGLSPDDFGREFSTGRERFRLVGIDPRRLKHPISAARIPEGASHRLDEIYRYTRNKWAEKQAEQCNTSPVYLQLLIGFQLTVSPRSRYQQSLA
jgi:hypothetical protein